MLGIGAYYLWQLRAAGERLDFTHPQIGYYNYLGRGFAQGHLYVPLEPTPQLLSFANPWDPALDEKYTMHDMVYFHRRYYLYHGAAPAVFLFTPWLLLTGHDLPERFAMFLWSFGGFLFSCGVLSRWLAIAGARPGPAWRALLFAALGLCTGVPYLLNRVAVYEIAIGGGYFFISAALYFLTRGVEAKTESVSIRWLAACGCLFGVAIGCRPHLGCAGGMALLGLAILFWPARRRLLVFAAAFLLVASLVPLYNYERFGNPFEFGIQYLLTGSKPIAIKLAWANLVPGFYFWLVCPPLFSPVFPWVRLVFRYPFNTLAYPFPKDYFIEAMTGALFLAPLLLGALPEWRSRRGVLLWTTLLSSLAVLLFLALTGFSTLRYEVDFLPMALLVALVALTARIEAAGSRVRMALRALVAAAILFGAVVNLALGIEGPYGEMLRARPVNYVRLARWFSPIEKHRPILDPIVDIRFTARFGPHGEGTRDPLLVLGSQPYRYFLFVEHIRGGLRFIALFREKVTQTDVPGPDNVPVDLRVTFAPESGEMSAYANGQQVAQHKSAALILAPSEITWGENHVEPGLTNERFSGQLTGRTAIIQPSALSNAKSIDIHD